jgi:ORF6N domain
MNSEIRVAPDGTPPTESESRIVPVDYIERRIYRVPEQNVMLDSDLADLYQVATGNLNLAVRRNLARFPTDFMFQMTKEEGLSLLLQSARANKGRGGRRTPPYVFTELGVAMLSSVPTGKELSLAESTVVASILLRSGRGRSYRLTAEACCRNCIARAARGP